MELKDRKRAGVKTECPVGKTLISGIRSTYRICSRQKFYSRTAGNRSYPMLTVLMMPAVLELQPLILL